jgi:membrane-bound hydrogenase subunit beta
MSDEQKIASELVQKFPFLDGKVRAPRARRVFADVPAASFQEVFQRAVKEMGFNNLCIITGLDLGENLGAIYHLARPTGEILNLTVQVPKSAPVLQTVTGMFPPADAYERELIDLLGFEVQGLPPGNRYPLPDGWPAGQYPLRKDWKEEMLGAAPDSACEMGAPMMPAPAKKEHDHA